MRSIGKNRTRFLFAATVALAAVSASAPSFAAQQSEGGVTARDALEAMAQRVQDGQLNAAHDITDAMRARCIGGVKLQQTLVGVDTLDRLITQHDTTALVAFAVAQDSTFVRDANSGFCSEGNITRQAPDQSEPATPPPPPRPPPPD